MDERGNARYNNGASNSNSSSSNWFGMLNVIFVVICLFLIYYLYRLLYSTASSSAVVLFKGTRPATTPLNNLPVAPSIFEGGEYSVNTWIYITGMNKALHSRKHIIELQGQYFSTLVVALGAFKNSLVVRTCTDSVLEAFASGSGSGSGSGSKPAKTTGSSNGTTTPNSGTLNYSLTKDNVNTLFAPMTMDDSILTTPVPCDLPEIDLQRWAMVTVVLNGRTTDVYIDGKLSRSCINSSFFRVDPTGVTPTITMRGGFDGYIGTTSAANYAMNPDEIYRAYLSGPNGTSTDILSWIVSIFKGSAAN